VLGFTPTQGVLVDGYQLRPAAQSGSGFFASLDVKKLQENRVLYILTDISSKIKANQQAAASQARLNDVVVDAQVGLWEYNLGTGLLTVNDMYLSLLGYKRDDIQLDSLARFEALIHPDDRDRVQQAWLAYASGHALQGEIEYRLKHADGHWVWISSHAHYSKPATQGGQRTLQGLQFDITRRVEKRIQLESLNRQLLVRTEQAEAAGMAKRQFVKAITHELKSPLTSILGYADLMKSRLKEPMFREMAEYMSKGAHQLNKLLTNIMDMVALEKGHVRVHYAPENLSSLLDDVVAFFGIVAFEKGLKLQASCDAAVPASVICDKLRVQQVLNILVSNALKFTKEGSVTLRAELQGEQVAIHVEDTGPGVADDAREKIFELFTQADGNISNDHGGTGLSLAMATGLVHLMQGSLTIDASATQGAKFTFTLPLRIKLTEGLDR
jgi:PAS domain S-box-containing protein